MSKYMKMTLLEAFLWLSFCVLAYAGTYRFDDSFSDFRYGAAGWPRGVIILIAVFTLTLLVTSLVSYRRNGEPTAPGPVSPALPEEAPAQETIGSISRLLGSFLMPLVYIFLLSRTGFYLTTPVFIAGYMYLLGERRLVHLVGTTLLIFVLCILIFTVLLYVPLPVGNWSGFYEINNAFLSLIK